MSNNFKLCPTRFSRGDKRFTRGLLSPCAPSNGPGFFTHSANQGYGNGYFVNRFRFHTYRFRFHSGVVETVSSETETWLKLQDRDLKARDRDSRPHISLMVIKVNSLKNAAKNIRNVAKYQDKFVCFCYASISMFQLRKICKLSCSSKNTTNHTVLGHDVMP